MKKNKGKICTVTQKEETKRCYRHGKTRDSNAA